MKKIMFFLIIFISNIISISPEYSYELIQEIIPKIITFETKDLNSFKIFKYISSCPDDENYKKSI